MEVGASVLAYFTVATVVRIVIASANDAVSHSKEKKLFISELEALSNVLTALREFIDSKASEEASVNNPTQDPWLRALKQLELFEDDAILHRTLVEVAEKLGVQLSDVESGTARSTRRGGRIKALKNVAIWAIIGKKELVELLARVQRMCQMLNLALSASSAHQIMDLARKTEKGLVHFESKISVLLEGQATLQDDIKRQEQEKQDKEDQKKTQQFIEWLDPVNNQAKHQSVCTQMRQGTCAWLHQHDDYVSFTSSQPGEILCLFGKPGTGKSVLCSAVIENLVSSMCPHIVYHYCDFRDTRSTSILLVIRSLLSQFVTHHSSYWRQKLSQHLTAEKKLNKAKLPSTAEALVDWILEGLDSLQSADPNFRQFIVVDALDECRDTESLIAHLLRLSAHPAVSLFLSSRHERDIVETLEEHTFISLDNEKSRLSIDIGVHIVRELEERRQLKKLPKSLKTEITTVLLEKSDGMFRWVQCQLDSLVDCRHARDVREALNNLPRTLYDTYARILVSIDEKTNSSETRMARRILRWLIGAKHPLTLSALNSALLIEVGKWELDDDSRLFDELDVLSICKSLVAFDEGRGIVTLSHFTVQEFLAQGTLANLQLAHYHVLEDSPELHTDLALQCLTYLLLNEFELGAAPDPKSHAARLQDFPLHAYASFFLRHHLPLAHEEDPQIYSFINQLIDGPTLQKYYAFTQTEHFMGRFVGYGAETPDPLEFANSWDAGNTWDPKWVIMWCRTPWLARRILGQHPEWINAPLVNRRHEIYGPMILWVVAHNLEWVLDTLLEMGADPCATKDSLTSQGSARAWSPLEKAFEHGDDRWAKKLLEFGARVGVHELRSATGHGRQHLFPLLFERCPPESLTAQERASILQEATRCGQPAALTRLVEGGALWDPSVLDQASAKGLLQAALEARAISCIEVLLKAGAPLKRLLFIPSDLRWASATSWHKEVVSALASRQRYEPLTIDGVSQVLGTLQLLGLPKEVALLIMDLGRFWVGKSCSCRDEVEISQSSVDRPYVQVTLPGMGTQFRSISFTTVSHDQGYSSERFTQGTYRDSYTWFDAAIYRAGTEVHWRRQVQVNVQASWDWRKHVNTWVLDTEDSELRTWLSCIEPGDTVSLIPKAQFPGWVNYVQSAEINIQYALSDA